MKIETIVALLQEQRTTGAGGRTTSTFIPVSELWASVVRKTHAPLMKGDRMVFPMSLVVRTAYHAVYLKATHIALDGQRYKITGAVGNHTVEDSYCEFTAKVSG